MATNGTTPLPGTSIGNSNPANLPKASVFTRKRLLIGGGILLLLLGIGLMIFFLRKKPESKPSADAEEAQDDDVDVDDDEEPTCPKGASLVDGVCRAATAIRDPRQTRSIDEQKAKADEKLKTSLVKGYTDKGNFRLLAGNSGWGYQQRIGGSVNECADICNNDNKCKGFSTTKYSSGQMECMMYNKGQTTGAKYYNECKADPGSVNECRTGVSGNLFWKN